MYILTARSRLQQAARVNLGRLADLVRHRVFRYLRVHQRAVARLDVQSRLDVRGVDDVPVAVEVQRGEESGERAMVIVPATPIAKLGIVPRAVVIIRAVVIVVGGGGGMTIVLLGGKVVEQSSLAALGVSEDLFEFRLVARALLFWRGSEKKDE